MKKILINENTWQTRVAITRNDKLQNINFWSPITEQLERAFFKGIITKVLPGIQTAFVEIGQERSGFLHISEIDRELAIKRMSEQLEDHIDDQDDINISDDLDNIDADHTETIIEESESKDSIPYKKPDIAKILNEGESILVQVSKEPIGQKGAKLTTCFTLPGRFLVLMPNIPRIGISKKIEDQEERQRLKDILKNNLPEGMGVIIRTTSEYKESKEILQDLSYLLAGWEDIVNTYRSAEPGEKIYEDIDLALQSVRDHLDKDVDLLICDNKITENRVYRFVKQVAPEFTDRIRYYESPPSLFEKFNIEKQIEQALNKKVNLKSGGSIIIESTEAMTVIDVNTGRYIGKGNLEDTVLKTNLEAAEEIVRQLRLRNIGGLIVIDFIDMSSNSNRQTLFKEFEKILKERDKFQSVVLKVSEFGLVQMTRKRSGKTLIQQLMQTCNCCRGLGYIKSISTESADILRQILEKLETSKAEGIITVSLHPDIFNYITNIEYNSILFLEKKYKCKITLKSQAQCNISSYNIEKSK